MSSVSSQAALLQDLPGNVLEKAILPALPQTTAQRRWLVGSSISTTSVVAAPVVAAGFVGAVMGSWLQPQQW